MSPPICNVMIFAAGKGTRMGSLTSDLPKPLIKVNGRALIDIILDRLVEFGFTKVVINVSYLGDQIQAHLSSRSDIKIVFSCEEFPLETGGGLVRALPLFDDPTGPILTINSDTIWKGPALLALLCDAWAPGNRLTMVFARCRQMALPGQFELGAHGEVFGTKRGEGSLVYAGIQLIDGALLKAHEHKATFSLADVFKAAKTPSGRLNGAKGVVFEGAIWHIGTDTCRIEPRTTEVLERFMSTFIREKESYFDHQEYSIQRSESAFLITNCY